MREHGAQMLLHYESKLHCQLWDHCPDSLEEGQTVGNCSKPKLQEIEWDQMPHIPYWSPVEKLEAELDFKGCQECARGIGTGARLGQVESYMGVWGAH